MAEIKKAHVVAMEALVEAATLSAACSNAERDADCSRVCSDVAELCWFGANLLSRGSRFMALMLKGIADALELCGKQCGSHKEGHCQRCSEACLKAAREAKRLIGELPVEGMPRGQWIEKHA
jgi:hypothetical protein